MTPQRSCGRWRCAAARNRSAPSRSPKATWTSPSSSSTAEGSSVFRWHWPRNMNSTVIKPGTTGSTTCPTSQHSSVREYTSTCIPKGNCPAVHPCLDGKQGHNCLRTNDLGACSAAAAARLRNLSRLPESGGSSPRAPLW
eukprot:CAMPEP_0204136852 /NCGR_PEP_ID=MMETSP0361-20130328/17066_1 /ASSEMBLY_ACC=CAM_ASM_000343 /TAXON_ID=268821 /ORGANISM="Scrippsiella Hangoei, Strain SHTV-5" /LENGTH=139 /DNA_ID=CAMNT_0051090427 /DNA_START=130 /DNA_END=546 /DNA_ORIENTATION=-